MSEDARLREAAWNAVAWFELFDLGEAEPEDARVAIAGLQKALEAGVAPALCPGCGEEPDAWKGADFTCEHPFHRIMGGGV